MADNIVIIGSGLAGYSLARELRKLNRQVSIQLVTRDDGGYYSKPMLSNSLSAGRRREQLTTSSAERMSEQLAIDVYAHTPMLAIDPGNREVVLKTQDGPEISQPFGALVLGLGADPIDAQLAGDAGDRIHSINDLGDYARVQEQLQQKRRVAILGAGFVGCEFANDLVRAGHEVTVIDPSSRPLSRWLPLEVGEYLQEALAEAGVEWNLNCRATAVYRQGERLRIEVGSSDDETGSVVEADLVLSSVGLRPRTAIATAAGIATGRGIITDEYLQTSHEDIYALGDCAEVSGQVLPFVMPLMAGARALAATLAGEPTPLNLPLMPITLKTPACPVVVLSPPQEVAGEWVSDVVEEGLRSLYFDRDDRLRGFALAGSASAERSKLMRQIGALRTAAPETDPPPAAT